MTSKEWLEEEVDAWKKDGIINHSQAQAILARYGLAKQPEKIDIQKKEDKHSNLIMIVSIIGAILVGLGIIVFVASNWQKIPAFFKLTLLFGTTFVTYFAGWKLEHNAHPKLGHALLFLGSLFTGATIFLTAQIFHVEANAHWLLLLWFLAVAPLSYGFDSKPTLILSLLIFGGWVGMYGKLDDSGVFLFYGLMLFGMGYLHEKTQFSRFKGSYQAFGLLFTLAILYAGIISELELIDKIGSHWLAYIFLILAFATVITSSFFLGKEVGKTQEFVWNMLAFIMAVSLWMLSQSPDILKAYSWPILITYHILFFVLVFFTVMSGYYQGFASFINVGLIFFVLYIGYFYFTTIFKYLPKSLALVIGGIVLLVGGWYLEKKRRSIIEEIEHK